MFMENESSREQVEVREFSANGHRMKTTEIEAKLDEGNIQEAESALCEGLSLNYEEARALLGRLEYQRGNVQGALCVFEGIDVQAAIQRLQTSIGDKPLSKKNRSRSELQHSLSQASLVLEALYLKSMSLYRLGMFNESAKECKTVLDAVEMIFHNGISDILVDNKIQEIVNKAVELLPEILKQAGCYSDSLSSYRSALLGQWNLDSECCVRIQKRFAIFLLYGGIEIGPPSLASQIDGSFVPKNNLEEAILLLMILLRKSFLGKTEWDPTIMDHLSYALSLCGQSVVLARQYEEVLPGFYPRCELWKNLALCYSGAGENNTALNLLRKSLNKHEDPDDPLALLLAAKICSEVCILASEGVSYAHRVIACTQESNEHLKAVGLRLLGICLKEQTKVASTDSEKRLLMAEALKSLNGAMVLQSYDPNLIFDMGILFACNHNLSSALQYAKQFITVTGGSDLKGWRLLALILSAEHQYAECEAIIDAALDETTTWDQESLLRMKAKLKLAQALPLDAIEMYRFLLALVQAQRKSFESTNNMHQVEHAMDSEFQIWVGLANLYSSLSQWKDTEVCLEKARTLKQYSATTLHVEGKMYETQGQTQEALTAYINATSLDLDHVPSKLSLGILLWKMCPRSLAVARCFITDILRIDPTNRHAWYYLGMVHRDDGRIMDASDCFQAASILDSDPIETFDSII